jgi:hypothetical protein
MSRRIQSLGFWTGMVGVALGAAYMAAMAALFISNTGFPPVEPYQTVISVVSIFSAPAMVFFWAILYIATPTEKKVFSLASLALIIIFATLTSINRYVSLTVVRQSYLLGKTEGLEWFLPYNWPSIMAAMEVLAWGFFLGLACLCLAPVFGAERLERAIFWTLLVSGGLCLLAALGQVLNSVPLNLLGIIAWGPGITLAFVLIALWFRRGMVLTTDLNPDSTD